MTQTLSIKQAYDIANAFITDKNTKMKGTFDIFSEALRYEFTTTISPYTTYQLIIFIPCGADNKYPKKKGEICLLKTNRHNDKTETIFVAKTKRSVNRIIDKRQRDIARAFTRTLSPRFSKLIANTIKRTGDRIKTTDNALFMKIYRIENNMR